MLITYFLNIDKSLQDVIDNNLIFNLYYSLSHSNFKNNRVKWIIVNVYNLLYYTFV